MKSGILASLKLNMGKLEKCNRIRNERYERKDYWSLKTPYQVREYYSSRVSMHPWAGNFSKDKRFQRTNWMCRCNKSREDEHHITVCPIYSDLRDKHGDLDCDANLVSFFRDALNRRDEMDKRNKEQDK